MPVIVVVGPRGEMLRHPVESGEARIGRDPSCEMRIEDPEIDPVHASVSLQLVLDDPGSSKGVFFQGYQVQQQILHVGDRIDLGSSGRIQLRIDPSESSPSPLPAAKPSATEAGLPEEIRRLAAEREALGEELESVRRERSETVATLEQRVGDLETELQAELRLFHERAGELRRELLARDRTVAELEQKVQELEAERREPGQAELLERVRALEAEKAEEQALFRKRLEELREETRERPASPPPGSAPAKLPEPSVFQTLVEFSQKLENTSNRILAKIAGRDSAGRQTLGSFLDSVRTESPEHARASIARYMNGLSNRWINSTLLVNRRGYQLWAADFLRRMSPRAIRERANVPWLSAQLGSEAKDLWQAYEAWVGELTPAVLVEQIDDSIRKVHAEFALQTGPES
ncbi:MAG: FHA domain-containing protein [Planctomycetota bacterium]